MKYSKFLLIIAMLLPPVSLANEIRFESMIKLYDQWLIFTEKENNWLMKNPRKEGDENLLLADLAGNKLVGKVLEKLSNHHPGKKLKVVNTALAYHTTKWAEGNNFDVCQVKIFFFFDGSVYGLPLCQSFIVRNDGEVLLQER